MNESATFIRCAAFNASDEGFTTFEYFFYLGSGVAGTALNVLTLIIAFTSIDTHDKPRQLLVINMTSADLLMCLVYMATRPYLHYFPKPLCYPYYVTICTVALSSCFYLLWLNVDKLLFLQFPLHYYQIVNRPKLIVVCLITWITITGLAMFVYCFMAFISEPARCDKVGLQAIIYTPICILYVLIITCSFIISFIIFLIAQNSSKIEHNARSRMFHRLFFLFSSTLWTFLTCLPYRMLYLGNIIYRQFVDTYCPTNAMRLITDIFFRLLVVGTVINPAITVLTQRAYRRRLLWYLYKLGILFHCVDSSNSDRKYSAFSSRLSLRGMDVRSKSLTAIQQTIHLTTDPK